MHEENLLFAMLAIACFTDRLLFCSSRAGLDHCLSAWGEPFIGKFVFIGKCSDLYDDGSARKIWHLDNYNPLENLECHTLNEEEIKGGRWSDSQEGAVWSRFGYLLWFLNIIQVVKSKVLIIKLHNC